MKLSTAKLIASGGQSAELLSAMADICGKTISTSTIAGVTLVCLGEEYQRIGALEPKRPTNARGDGAYGSVEVSYQDVSRESGREMIRIYIGVVGIGPVLQADADGWVNCYPHGNCGKNWSDGGTWYSPGRRITPPAATIAEALAARHSHTGEEIHDRIVDADILRTAPILAMLS